MPGRLARCGASGLLLCAAAAFSSCAVFSSKPPLPKHASIERRGSPAAATDYRALVEEAQVIYFPQERAASSARSEPAALLLEAMQQSGKPYAVGWSLVDASQQALLDALQTSSGSPRDELVAQLRLVGTGRAREHCRSVLRDARLAGLRHIALHVPRPLLDKVVSGAPPTPEERDLVPRGFAAPPGGFQAYAERLAHEDGVNPRTDAGAYRAEVLQRQFAAETIVRFFRAAPSDARLLVFSSSAEFADGHGIPYYVAQKIELRQLVFDREASQPARSPLLTGLERGLGGSVEVVDGTPRPARD